MAAEVAVAPVVGVEEEAVVEPPDFVVVRTSLVQRVAEAAVGAQ